MKFKASYDLTVKIITGLIILLFTVIAFYSGFEIIKSNGDLFTTLIHSIVNVFQIGIIVLCFIYSPMYYILNEDSLIIKRLISDHKIPLNEISVTRLLEPAESRGIIRTFGVGGLFGYFGKFASRKLGSMTWYASQSKNKVLIILKSGKKIVITPDDVALIDAININQT